MTRQRRRQEELRKASDHLFYEIWMFRSLADGLASGVFGRGPAYNAVLESFTIHARCLLDVLYARNPQGDDVIAEDFFPAPEKWRNARLDEPDVLGLIRGRVGKEIAHLTYARSLVAEEAKRWPIREIASALNAAITRFEEHVPREFLGSRWEGSNVATR